MPGKRVKIPDIGYVTFPDSMSSADIQAAIENDILKKKPQAKLDIPFPASVKDVIAPPEGTKLTSTISTEKGVSGAAEQIRRQDVGQYVPFVAGAKTFVKGVEELSKVDYPKLFKGVVGSAASPFPNLQPEAGTEALKFGAGLTKEVFGALTGISPQAALVTTGLNVGGETIPGAKYVLAPIGSLVESRHAAAMQQYLKHGGEKPKDLTEDERRLVETTDAMIGILIAHGAHKYVPEIIENLRSGKGLTTDEYNKVRGLLPQQSVVKRSPGEEPLTTFEVNESGQAKPVKAVPPGVTERRPSENLSDVINTLRSRGQTGVASKIERGVPLSTEEMDVVNGAVNDPAKLLSIRSEIPLEDQSRVTVSGEGVDKVRSPEQATQRRPDENLSNVLNTQVIQKIHEEFGDLEPTTVERIINKVRNNEPLLAEEMKVVQEKAPTLQSIIEARGQQLAQQVEGRLPREYVDRLRQAGYSDDRIMAMTDEEVNTAFKGLRQQAADVISQQDPAYPKAKGVLDQLGYRIDAIEEVAGKKIVRFTDTKSMHTDSLPIDELTKEAAQEQIHGKLRRTIEGEGGLNVRIGGLAPDQVTFADPLTGSNGDMKMIDVNQKNVQAKIGEIRDKDFPATQALRELGYTRDQINSMTSDQASAILGRQLPDVFASVEDFPAIQERRSASPMTDIMSQQSVEQATAKVEQYFKEGKINEAEYDQALKRIGEKGIAEGKILSSAEPTPDQMADAANRGLALGILERDVNGIQQMNPSWSDAFTESLDRYKKKGISPDTPQQNLAAGLDPSVIFDPAKVKYVLDPILNKAKQEAQNLIDQGTLAAEELANKVKELTVVGLTNNPDFVRLPIDQRRKLLNYINTGYAANLRSGRFEEAAQSSVAESSIKLPNASIEAQRRGQRSHETTEDAATRQTKMINAAREGKIKPGTAFNAEQLEAIDSEVNRIGKMIGDKGIDETLKTETPQSIANVLLTAMGAHAEAGRALEILGKNVDPSVAEAFVRLAETSRDPALKKIVGEAHKILKAGKNVPPTMWAKLRNWMDMVAEFGRNIKLASLSPLSKSVVGNTVMQLFKYPDLTTEISLAKARAAIFGIETDRTYKELAADWVGFKSGFHEGNRLAWEMVKENQKAIEENAFYSSEINRPEGAIPGQIGTIIRTPQRLHGALDAFYRVPTGRGLLGRFAARKAFAEGLTGDRWINRVDELMKNPTPDMVARASTDATYYTFQQELGNFGKAISRLRFSFPMSQTVVPFFNTPVNLFKSIVERTPLAPLTPSFLKPFVETFLKPRSPNEAFDVKMSRLLNGTVFMSVLSTVIYKAMNGEISGRGATLKQDRDAMERTGWRPYSLRVGNNWISYQGYEPMSGLLSVIADASQKSDDEPTKEAVKRVTIEFARNFAENPFLVGVNDLMDALRDPEGFKAEKAIAGYATGMVVPTIVQQSRWIVDPTVKKPKGIIESVKSRLPGAAGDIPVARDVFGEPKIVEEPGTKLVGVSLSHVKHDPVEDEIQRLKLRLGWASDTYAGIKLTPEQHDQLLEVAGKQFKIALNNLIGSPAYKELPDQFKIDAITNTQNVVRDIQRKTLLLDVEFKGLEQKLDKTLTGLVPDTEKEKTLESLRRAIGQQSPSMMNRGNQQTKQPVHEPSEIEQSQGDYK